MGEFADSSVEWNHAKPSSTMSAPVRLSGRRREAYRPVPMKLHPTAGPMKLHPTAGPKIAHTNFASWWSLARTSATTPAPLASAAKTTPSTRVRVIPNRSVRGALGGP